MVKSISKVAIAVCLLGSMPVWAVERATFIMTSSEKISGTVVYHGDNRENLINGFLNIGVGDNKEQTFPVDQVAVIDFIGGTPSNQELAALPGSGHLLALRDGTTRAGQFVNLIGGDTLKWREADGNVRDLPIGQVSRIYLNPGSARNTFNYTAAPATTAATATTGTGGGVSVRADQAWTNTGIVVRKGQAVRFSTSGEIKYSPGASDTAGPDGNAASKSPTLPVPAMNGGGLIGRVGTSAPFPIGSNSNAITMPADGTLMLGVNDDITTDNSGAFVVTVTPAAVRR